MSPARRRATTKSGPVAVPPPVLDYWIIEKTPIWHPYPCKCSRDKPCRKTCKCNGRTDVKHLPRFCCAATKPEPSDDTSEEAGE